MTIKKIGNIFIASIHSEFFSVVVENSNRLEAMKHCIAEFKSMNEVVL